MSSTHVHICCVSTTGRGNGQSRDERRPLELFGARKENGGRICEKLKGILPGGLDGREDAALIGFNFLVRLLETMQDDHGAQLHALSTCNDLPLER